MSEKEEEMQDKSETLRKIEAFTKEGHKLLQDGDLVNSFPAYEKAFELAEETDEAFTVRACLFNLGACCVAKGDASKGLEYLLRAIPPHKDGDGSMNFADLHYNMAVAYDMLGKASEARKCYETSLDGYKTNTNLEMQGEVYLKLGGTLTSLRMFEQAAKAFEEGQEIFEKLQDERHEMLCLSSRATLLAEMRNGICQELLNILVDRVENLKNDLLKGKESKNKTNVLANHLNWSYKL